MKNQQTNALDGFIFAVLGLLLSFLIGVTFLTAERVDIPGNYISWITPVLYVVFLLNAALTSASGATYISNSFGGFLLTITILVITSVITLVTGLTANNFLIASGIERVPFWITYASTVCLSLGYSYFLLRRPALKKLIGAN